MISGFLRRPVGAPFEQLASATKLPLPPPPSCSIQLRALIAAGELEIFQELLSGERLKANKLYYLASPIMLGQFFR